MGTIKKPVQNWKNPRSPLVRRDRHAMIAMLLLRRPDRVPHVRNRLLKPRPRGKTKISVVMVNNTSACCMSKRTF